MIIKIQNLKYILMDIIFWIVCNNCVTSWYPTQVSLALSTQNILEIYGDLLEIEVKHFNRNYMTMVNSLVNSLERNCLQTMISHTKHTPFAFVEVFITLSKLSEQVQVKSYFLFFHKTPIRIEGQVIYRLPCRLSSFHVDITPYLLLFTNYLCHIVIS